MAPIDVSCLSEFATYAFGSLWIVSTAPGIFQPDNQNIIQPKPTRPLNGVSLLQDQVAGDVPLPESVKHVKVKEEFP
jgi:hypothetical protein